jgi:hypothetical protein
MRILLDIKDGATNKEIVDSIKMARKDGCSMGGPTVDVTLLDQDTPELQEWYDAGLECINAAGYMYDGCIFDQEDAIQEMDPKEVKDRVAKIHKIVDTLGLMIHELGFERGLIYKLHNEW